MTSFLRSTVFLLLIVAANAQAQWQLEPDESSLSFISIKAGSVAETHRFTELSGEVGKEGNAMIRVAADSIDTGIDIRDQRMRSLLLETVQFPELTITARIDPDQLERIKPGQAATMETEVQLQVRQQNLVMTIPLLVTRLDEQRLMVSTRQAVVVNAGQLNLLDGIEQLRKIAGLPSITPAVPVNFVLSFVRTATTA